MPCAILLLNGQEVQSSTHTAAAIHHEREEARLRSAAGQEVHVYASDDTGWTVVSEADSQWRATPLHRFVRVYPVAGLEALSGALSPLSAYLSSVALAGFGAQRDTVTHKILELGASRVCIPGALQTPPLGWHHDGRPLLLPLARLHDDENLDRLEQKVVRLTKSIMAANSPEIQQRFGKVGRPNF